MLLLSEPIEGVDKRGGKNLRKNSQDHGAGDRCGESVGILYSSAAENNGQNLPREKPSLSPESLNDRLLKLGPTTADGTPRYRDKMISNVLGPHTGAPRSEYRNKKQSKYGCGLILRLYYPLNDT